MVEGRFLSMRAHARELGVGQPRRILATGGGSKNAEVCLCVPARSGCVLGLGVCLHDGLCVSCLGWCVVLDLPRGDTCVRALAWRTPLTFLDVCWRSAGLAVACVRLRSPVCVHVLVCLRVFFLFGNIGARVMASSLVGMN